MANAIVSSSSGSQNNKKGLRRASTVIAAAFIAATIGSSFAVAKPGGGGSVGSRGSRTYSAPAATPTAPTGATPFARSTTPAAAPAAQQARPGGFNPAAAPARPASRFGTGLMAGLLGAGLFGALLGSGFMGGLGGLMSFIGLFLQVALIGMLIMFALRWFRGRSSAGSMAMAGAGNAPTRQPLAGDLANRSAMSGSPAGASRPLPRNVRIEPSDYQAFERLLSEVQGAYSQENVNTLKAIATPEMTSYFEEELSENSRRGVVNRVSNVKLLQGDLSEAWGEANAEYATVAMRYALVDETLDRSTGKPTPGSQNGPQEATEYWTFVRPANAANDAWKLSAIQQAA
ncbi:MAG: TIM44-like domain-containing protein [Beijerinckiaceae bacterium]|nr:TIM44-like domain-containing protein [Beijerinckiaceae bacterium]